MSQVTLEDRAHALENEYFHKQEAELIAKMRAKLESEEREASALECPKCHGKLVNTDFENIKVDICNNCHGVWLDAGELTRVLHHDEDKGGWFHRIFG